MQNASFDPGGWLYPPKHGGSPNEQRLSLKVYPRYNFYLSSEKSASLVVETPVRYYGSVPFKNETYDPERSPGAKIPFTEIEVYVGNGAKNLTLLNWVRVPVNSSGTEVGVTLEGVDIDGLQLSSIGTSPDGLQTVQGGSDWFTVLPERNDTGSMARIDRLHGGLEVRSRLTGNAWKPIFPFSFYTSWDWIASTLRNADAPKTLRTFRALGYNIIHPVPPGGSEPFDATLFSQFLALCDDLELYIMYDMRHTYQNNTSISAQLARLQRHPSLLLYYTADEPDGSGDPLNATALAYAHIHAIDPYHPVSLVLNCANFYFADYTAGADIILEDTYPLIHSSAFSPVYNTPCNATYGDCGCDNCHAADPAYPAYMRNPFLDISERVDDMYVYQEWLPPARGGTKPVWGVPQAFFDANSFWSRWPNAREEAVMALLRINHGAKGIVAWIYPTSDELELETSRIATVITRTDVTGLLLRVERMALQASGEGDVDLVDAAAWVGPEDMLVIVVNQGRNSTVGKAIDLKLPKAVQEVEVLYGYAGWKLGATLYTLSTSELEGLDVSILKAKIART